MIYIIIGLIGAIVMFCGDMTLYYTPDDFDYESGKNQNVMQAVVDVMKKLRLSDRVYSCECGFTMDRDQNAALNILKEGLRLLKEAV